MTSQDRLRTIISGAPADRCGFWLGNPHPDTLPIYHKYFGTSSLDELQQNLREVVEMLLEDGDPQIESEFVGVQTIKVA